MECYSWFIWVYYVNKRYEGFICCLMFLGNEFEVNFVVKVFVMIFYLYDCFVNYRISYRIVYDFWGGIGW